MSSVQDLASSMNPRVRSVRSLEIFELEVMFENGECRRFDLKPYLGRGFFERLREPELFKRVKAVAGSIEWPGGSDLSYDTLYVDGQPFNSPTSNSVSERVNETPSSAS